MEQNNEKVRPNADGTTVVTHWLLVITIIVSLITGLTIASDDLASLTGEVGRMLPWLTIEGEVHLWHMLSGYVFFVSALVYAIYLFSAGRVRRVAPQNATWWSTIRNIGTRRSLMSLNIKLYHIAFVMVVLMTITGTLLYIMPSSRLIANIHGFTALGFVIYAIAHSAVQLGRGMFFSIFRPRWQYTVASLAAISTAAMLTFAVAEIDQSSFSELLVAPSSEPPVIDGKDDDLAWYRAPSVKIMTARGVNLPGGNSEVEIRSVTHGKDIYFLFKWDDPTKSEDHLPLKKTADGWKVLQSEFEINDEDTYYEDKFSVVLSRTPEFGSGTVNIGKKLLPGPHRPTTRGMHFSRDGRLRDMWHWKSIRTGASGQIDDNFFGPPLPSEKKGERYTGGYGKDKKKGGGYFLNWKKLAKGPLNDVYVEPRFLPPADSKLPFIRETDAIPYSSEADNMPVGTVIPGVVVKGPFVGDRGDITARHQWRDGKWTLEAKRSLDTGSDKDVAFLRDVPTYLWVAVFNHTQTRHTQHLRPVRVVLN